MRIHVYVLVVMLIVGCGKENKIEDNTVSSLLNIERGQVAAREWLISGKVTVPEFHEKNQVQNIALRGWTHKRKITAPCDVKVINFLGYKEFQVQDYPNLCEVLKWDNQLDCLEVTIERSIDGLRLTFDEPVKLYEKRKFLTEKIIKQIGTTYKGKCVAPGVSTLWPLKNHKTETYMRKSQLSLKPIK